jgi:hypothetical protein
MPAKDVKAYVKRMRGAVHMQITTIGLDIAKNVFQFHALVRYLL